jgi:hypothetical protein
MILCAYFISVNVRGWQGSGEVTMGLVELVLAVIGGWTLASITVGGAIVLYRDRIGRVGAPVLARVTAPRASSGRVGRI